MDADKLRKLANAARDEALEWFKDFGRKVTVRVVDRGGTLQLKVVIVKPNRTLEGMPQKFNQIKVEYELLH